MVTADVDAAAFTPWPVDRATPEPNWQPPEGTWVISADDHVVEHDLWIDRLPKSDRHRAPRIFSDFRGYHLSLGTTPLDTQGVNSLLFEGRPGAWDIERRLSDMDSEGVDASFVFSQRTMALCSRIDDSDFRTRCVDAYNEWLATEVQGRGRGRLFGIAILPTVSRPEATRDYIQKLVDLGFVALQLPSSADGVRYNAWAMEPLWEAVEESGLPLSFHAGIGHDLRGAGALGTSITVGLQPFRELWCLLTFSGILERHPDMRVVFTEGGASWVPSALFDADRYYKAFVTELRPRLAHLPSYYWRRQCYATFTIDPPALKLVDEIGAERMLWSMDYPHPEGTLGESNAVLQSIFERVGEDAARKIVGGNALRVWGLDTAKIASPVH